MSTAPTQLLRMFGTRHQTTEIARDDAGELWWSWSRTTPFALGLTTSKAFRTSVEAACRSASGSDFIFKLPDKLMQPGGASWKVPGTTSAAESFLPRPSQNLDTAVSGLDWERLGAALAVYHAQSSTGDRGCPTTPVGLVRLREWMSAAVVDADAGWRDELTQTLGGPRWRRVQRMAADLDAASQHVPDDGEGRLLHGWFSLGSIVLPDDPRAPTVILSGPDICMGYAEYDLGTVIGELTEFGYLAEIQNLRADPYYNAARSILDSYRLHIDAALLHSSIVSRILLHTYDFATNIGWSDELSIYSEMLCETIDSDLKWLFFNS
ncbi:hypothetical protein [Nocardia amamiensis]|uniref:hypothetical protein n=1 Tax=Nocardia amamiensis TaxID=404578 RepID=UPI0033DCE74F